MKVLTINPEKDCLTRYLLVWTNMMVDEMEGRHEFVRLINEGVNRERVLGTLQKANIDAVLFNGHGSDTQIEGQDEIIFDTNDVDALDGKVVHALSCDTAKTLGVLAKEAGAKEYVGYDEKFVLAYRDDKVGHPESDDTASLFLDPAFSVPRALLEGKTGKEAVEYAKKAYNRSIKEALNSDMQSDNDQFIGWLFWDRDHLVAC